MNKNKKIIIIMIILLIINILLMILFNIETIKNTLIQARNGQSEIGDKYSKSNDKEWWINLLADLGKYQNDEAMLKQLEESKGTLTDNNEIAECDQKIAIVSQEITTFKAKISQALVANGIDSKSTDTMEKMANDIATLIDLRKGSISAFVGNTSVNVEVGKKYLVVLTSMDTGSAGLDGAKIDTKLGEYTTGGYGTSFVSRCYIYMVTATDSVIKAKNSGDYRAGCYIFVSELDGDGELGTLNNVKPNVPVTFTWSGKLHIGGGRGQLYDGKIEITDLPYRYYEIKEREDIVIESWEYDETTGLSAFIATYKKNGNSTGWSWHDAGTDDYSWKLTLQMYN